MPNKIFFHPKYGTPFAKCNSCAKCRCDVNPYQQRSYGSPPPAPLSQLLMRQRLRQFLQYRKISEYRAVAPNPVHNSTDTVQKDTFAQILHELSRVTVVGDQSADGVLCLRSHLCFLVYLSPRVTTQSLSLRDISRSDSR